MSTSKSFSKRLEISEPRYEVSSRDTDITVLTNQVRKKNCINCARYLRCTDKRKSISFKCKEYKQTRESSKEGAIRLLDLAGIEGIRASDLQLEFDPLLDDFDIQKVVNAALEDGGLVPPDVKVPDGDFKLAPNFLSFCSSEEFLNQKPFVSQALIGIRLFGEYCPKCSDTEYFDEYKVDDKLSVLQKKICLLEFGKCPGCSKKKDYFLAKELLNPYQELALCAGQRSGKSALTGMLSTYTLHRMIKLQNPSSVYGLMKGDTLHGTFVALTYAQAKDTLWSPFYAHLLESPWFCIEKSSRISLSDGTTKEISDISVGTLVRTPSGPKEVLQVFDNGIKECLEITTDSGNVLQGTGDHLVQCLSLDGNSLIWKKFSDITIEDFVVVE